MLGEKKAGFWPLLPSLQSKIFFFKLNKQSETMCICGILFKNFTWETFSLPFINIIITSNYFIKILRYKNIKITCTFSIIGLLGDSYNHKQDQHKWQHVWPPYIYYVHQNCFYLRSQILYWLMFHYSRIPEHIKKDFFFLRINISATNTEVISCVDTHR